MNTFNYNINIQTSPEKLWNALIKPEYTSRYWIGITLDSDWQVGSPVTMSQPMQGKNLELPAKVTNSDPPALLSYKFDNEMFGTFHFEIKPLSDSETRLIVTHEGYDQSLHDMFVDRWYGHIGSLKTLMETGSPIDHSRWK